MLEGTAQYANVDPSRASTWTVELLAAMDTKSPPLRNAGNQHPACAGFDFARELCGNSTWRGSLRTLHKPKYWYFSFIVLPPCGM